MKITGDVVVMLLIEKRKTANKFKKFNYDTTLLRIFDLINLNQNDSCSKYLFRCTW